MSSSHGSGIADDEVRSGLPEEQDRSISDSHAMMSDLSAMFASIGPSGAMHHPIFAKFKPEHVAQFLDHAHKSDVSTSRFRSTNRWFNLAYVLIIVAVFLFLTVLLLPDQSDLYFDILKGIGIFLGGAGGGYGLKTFQDRNRAR